jgi:hypothetical protein
VLCAESNLGTIWEQSGNDLGTIWEHCQAKEQTHNKIKPFQATVKAAAQLDCPSHQSTGVKQAAIK